GKALVSYIFGYASKKLIQVNIVWGTTIDPQVKPDRIVAAANQLRALFLGYPYQADTVASNVPTADGTITVFQGREAHDLAAPGQHASPAAAEERQGGSARADRRALPVLRARCEE